MTPLVLWVAKRKQWQAHVLICRPDGLRFHVHSREDTFASELRFLAEIIAVTIFLRVIRRRKRNILGLFSLSKDMKYSYAKYCKPEVISRVLSYRRVADSRAILFGKISLRCLLFPRKSWWLSFLGFRSRKRSSCERGNFVVFRWIFFSMLIVWRRSVAAPHTQAVKSGEVDGFLLFET